MKNKQIDLLIKITCTIVILLLIAFGALVVYNHFVANRQAQSKPLNEQNTGQTNNNLTNGQVANLNNVQNNLPIVNEQNTIANNVNQNNNIIIPNLSDNPQQNNMSTPNGTVVSTYYYSQLDDTGKTIYDALKKNKENLKTGTYSIDFGMQFNTLLHEEGGEEKLNIAFQSAWNAFSYDECDLFYIDATKINLLTKSQNLGGIVTYYISIGPEANSTYLQSGFQTKEQIESAINYIERIVKQINEQTKNDTDVEKVTRIHDWLVGFISYDTTDSNINNHNIYGALYNRQAVCEGYAKTFKYLLERVNVPSVLVSGTATNSTGVTETHAWNYVILNNQWYAIDVTWNDPVIIGGGQLTVEQMHKYFLKGSDEFLKDHKEDGKVSERSMTFKFPTLAIKNYK